MLFNSFQFAIFLPLVVAIYFALPHRFRLPMLLVASCVFYMAFIPAYILILFVTVGIDYFAGIYIENTIGATRKRWLIGSITSTCAVLFIFKYFDFFTGNFVGISGLLGWHLTRPALRIILPIGLSFHTFQSLSYVIEVYRGKQKAERNFVVYATYVMFFPQLVAGPIERPQNLLHQFYQRHEFDHAMITSGLKRMAWGFFKKLVIADRLALYVNDVYGYPRGYNGLQLSLASFFFAYQIYCDFSGYSDIAIGTARILGFRLMENFDTPYCSKSIGEFWRRWHISLSFWFRDYVYIPLGGNRLKSGMWCCAIAVTFGISGLWHGANWTYVVWGLLNAVYLIFGRVSQKVRDRLWFFVGLSKTSVARTAAEASVTFVLICIGWIVFRANTLSDAAYILSHWFRGWDMHHVKTEQFLLRQMPIAVGSIVLLESVQYLNRRIRVVRIIEVFPLLPRWLTYSGAALLVLLFGVYRHAQFIYFQF